ncbi:MAG: beta-galactosidase [Limisphaerales bacterium]
MKVIFKFYLLAFLVTFAISTPAATPLDYSDVSKPEFFPIMTWDPQHGWTKPFADQPKNGLEAIAECNFNTGGFVFPADLARCEKLGLGGILLPLENDFTNWDYFHTWWKMSDAEIDGRIKRLVSAAGSSAAFAGVFIVDEPHVREFPGLAKAVAAVKKYAPGKLAYINLHPITATINASERELVGTDSYTNYLERFVNEVHPQVLSYDNYVVQYSNDLKDEEKAASYFQNLLEVRRVGQKYHLPYLNIVSSNEIKPYTPIPSPGNMLLQAYTTVAAGYRGVTWYTFYSRGYAYAPIDNNGNRTLTFEYLNTVNRQIATLAPILCRLESTGVFFSKPAPAADLTTLPGKLIEAVTSSTPVMVGEFSGARETSASQERYAMVVNLSLESTTQLHLMAADQRLIKIVSAVDRSLSNYDAKNGLWLNPGQGVLLAL